MTTPSQNHEGASAPYTKHFKTLQADLDFLEHFRTSETCQQLTKKERDYIWKAVRSNMKSVLLYMFHRTKHRPDHRAAIEARLAAMPALDGLVKWVKKKPNAIGEQYVEP